jgi:hypothetical protein
VACAEPHPPSLFPLGTPLSRRAVVRHAGAVGLSLLGVTLAGPRAVHAAPTVAVAPPRIMRLQGCAAPIEVAVTLAALTPGVHYQVTGAIWEADDEDDEDDFCCTLTSQSVVAEDRTPTTCLLTRQVLATTLGLQRGVGPAADETTVPPQVELYARVWLRAPASGEWFGSWESPRRLVDPSPRLLWTRPEGLPGQDLMTPRGSPSPTSDTGPGMPLPPQACVP